LHEIELIWTSLETYDSDVFYFILFYFI